MKINTEVSHDTKQLNELCGVLSSIRLELSKLQTTSFSNDNRDDSIKSRVADLEVKMSKLWGLLTLETPSHNTKLTNYGRLFKKRFN